MRRKAFTPLPPVVLKPRLDQELTVVWSGTMDHDRTAQFELSSDMWHGSTLEQERAFPTSKQVNWARTLSI